MKIISIDAETNGLWGKPFSIAAIVYEFFPEQNKGVSGIQSAGWKKTDSICLRIPDLFVTNEWVKENVLPTLEGVKITHQTEADMLKDFASFYMSHKDAQVIWHMGHVVEAYLFRLMVEQKVIGEWDAPYTPIEVATLLEAKGFKADSVDQFAKDNGIVINYGSTHNPLYDCEVTAEVYFKLKKI